MRKENTVHSQIFADIKRIQELRARIQLTFELRHRSSGHLDAWHRACVEYRRQIHDLSYPGGLARWEAFKNGDTSENEVAISYLEVDPWLDGSGYKKEVIWQRLKRRELCSRALRRLEQVALNYLNLFAHRHFWSMVRFVRIRAGEGFWAKVEVLSSSSERSPSAIKATWLLLAGRNHPVRRWIGYARSGSPSSPSSNVDLDFRARLPVPR